MSRDNLKSRRDSASPTQTSGRRTDHRQRRHARGNGQRPDETRRARLSPLYGVEPGAWRPQCRADDGRLSRNQVELAWNVKRQSKIVTAITTAMYRQMKAING